MTRVRGTRVHAGPGLDVEFLEPPATHFPPVAGTRSQQGPVLLL